MNELNNHDYYLRRAQHSRQLADNAASPAIARIHQEMATRYEELAAATRQEANEKRLPET
ncbi:hypothetical protein ACBY01_14415 [Sphingomonas sp. ac-8]|uniref:hypothetical protein n=1 Tax=Sphingomonas sp. ac-8 TaxID=3242977 RepID=UPI003A808684